MERTPKILVVEDDTDINNLIRRILEKRNYQVVQSFSGTEGCLRLELERYDLLILDLMLPGMDGKALIRKLREEKGQEMPVLILSARTSLEDKVQLLTTGADDYMTKPFEPEELLARVHAALRRAVVRQAEKKSMPVEVRNGRTGEETAGKEIFSYKHLCLFPEGRRCVVKGQELLLTPHEYDILTILVQAPGKVFSRETLYELVWSSGYYGEDNTVNVHVSNIRKKIAAADPGEEYIKTVWGIGFKMA